MTEQELIARLRAKQVCTGFEQVEDDAVEAVYGADPLAQEAADRIEALVKERDILVKRHERNLIAGAETRARAERLEAALKRVLQNVDEDGVGTVLMIDLIHARATLTQKDRTDG